MTPNSEEAKLLKALLEEVKRLTLAVNRIERLLQMDRALDTGTDETDVIPLEG